MITFCKKVFSSSSEGSGEIEDSVEKQTSEIEVQPERLDAISQFEIEEVAQPEIQRKSNLKSLTERLQDTFRSFTFSNRRNDKRNIVKH
ncbi:unnamed protein product [Leptosia nina]|uniref:Uncharacterized protein n=1 Tax=Leptosia nina TaxID=320188 RepID=A0AAV1K048_9NEOP